MLVHLYLFLLDLHLRMHTHVSVIHCALLRYATDVICDLIPSYIASAVPLAAGRFAGGGAAHTAPRSAAVQWRPRARASVLRQSCAAMDGGGGRDGVRGVPARSAGEFSTV